MCQLGRAQGYSNLIFSIFRDCCEGISSVQATKINLVLSEYPRTLKILSNYRVLRVYLKFTVMPMVNGTPKFTRPPPTFERKIVCFYSKPPCEEIKCNSSLTKFPVQAKKGSLVLPLSMSILHVSLTALACFGPIDWSIASDLKSEGTVFGAARVVDGDTLVVNGVRIRLYGIDAPEKKQTCEVSGKDVACGMESTQALESEIGGGPVACSLHGRDLYGRGIGVCSVESKPGVITDLNSWMVDKGHAVAYRKYSSRYVQQELSAQKSKLGIWAGSFKQPEEWRREHLHRKISK